MEARAFELRFLVGVDRVTGEAELEGALAAGRIAASGGLYEARVFALNTDKNLYLNSGDGCDQYWHFIGYPWDTKEITGANFTTLYALNNDHSLWRGTVNHADWLSSLSFGHPRHCDGSRLVE